MGKFPVVIIYKTTSGFHWTDCTAPFPLKQHKTKKLGLSMSVDVNAYCDCTWKGRSVRNEANERTVERGTRQ